MGRGVEEVPTMIIFRFSVAILRIDLEAFDVNINESDK